MSGKRVVIRSRDGEGGKGRCRCPYCHASILEGVERTWSCPACSTVHHTACAAEHGRCTVQGCPGRPKARRRTRGGLSRSRPRESLEERQARIRAHVRAEHEAAVASETRVAGVVGFAVALGAFALHVSLSPASLPVTAALLALALANLVAGGRDLYTGDLEVSWTGSLWLPLWSFILRVLFLEQGLDSD